MSLLTRWVLQRRAATILITLLVIALGIFAVTQLQEELLPNIDFPYLFVTTAYPGASSQVVSDQVSRPIEATASQLAGVQQVTSTSLQGFSIVTVQLNYGTNLDTAEQKLTTQLRGVTLPTTSSGTVLQPTVSVLGFNSQPIVYLSVQGVKGQSIAQIGQWADTVAEPALSKVNDVGTVQVTGDTSQQVAITLNPATLAAHGLTVQSIVSALQSQGITFPAGTADIAGQTVPIRVTASFADVSALERLIIVPTTTSGSAQSSARSAAPIRLEDVAAVQMAPAYPNGISRTNGQQGILLQVYKSQNGNTVRASDGILSEITQLNHDYPTYRVSTLYDTAQPIRDSISGLVRDGLLGALFAILVIFLFLRSVRSTLVTAISIPTSIVVAFILLWTQGITLNTLTLGGLAIAVGRVVDDAIVVLENIYRHVQQGDPVPVAVRDGAREVATAITSSTATTIAVFLPLAFIGGIVGQFFVPFALTVTFALVASLLVALTVVPVFASYFITPRAVGHPHASTLLQRIYTPILKWALGHRWTTVGIAFALLVVTLASVAIVGVPTGLLPNSNTNLIEVTISTRQGADPSATANAVLGIESVLNRYHQEGKIQLYESTISGGSAFDRTVQALSGRNTTATMLLTLPSSVDANALASSLRHDLQPDTPAGGSIAVTPSNSFGGNTLSYVVQGPDAVSVKQGSDAVVNALSSLSGTTNLRSDVSAVQPQIVVTPDPTKSPLANTTLIGGEISQLLQGQTAGSITFANGTQAQVLVEVPGFSAVNTAQYIAQLQQLPLGGGLTLGQVATVQEIDGVTQITRINQALAATISADITANNSGSVTSAAAARLRGLALPAGDTLTQSGAGQQQSQAFTGLAVALLAAVALVYIVMVIAFGSLLEPFAILFSLPLAAIGGLGALVITQHEIDISSLIGFLMLIGLVVTNAIVLMDLVNQLRAQGYSREAALVQAGRTRLRPILMTAVATILALLPLALGFGDNGGSIIAADLGVVVIGGLLTSTLLTLVVVPVIYSLLDGASERLTGRHAQAPTPPPEHGGEEVTPEPATTLAR
jgi:HAE1 family hydrophobic/amphiphilic exporter-1